MLKGLGLYPWFRERGLDFIHPDDLETIQSHSPYCVVCDVIGKDGPYLVIRFGPHQFRGKPELFQPVSPPAFRIGQCVTTKAPRTARIGVIRGISWHYCTNAPLFTLAVNGKALKSRYWAAELEAVSAPEG